MACSLRSTSITLASSLLRSSPPLTGASVLSALRLAPLVPFPLASPRRFSRSVQEPSRASRRLHAGCRSGSRVVNCRNAQHFHSAICSPDPPNSVGKSLNFGRPSRIGRTVSARARPSGAPHPPTPRPLEPKSLQVEATTCGELRELGLPGVLFCGGGGFPNVTAHSTDPTPTPIRGGGHDVDLAYRPCHVHCNWVRRPHAGVGSWPDYALHRLL